MLTVERVKNYKLFSNGRWTVGIIKAPYAARRQAMIDKKKADEMPQDSLLIIDNRTFAIQKIPGVKSYKTAQEPDFHVAYTLTLPKDTTNKKKQQTKRDCLVAKPADPA